MIKIAFIDIIGLQYDGNTLKERGLGGSESAVIYMSRELAQLGFEVDVYNNCEDLAKPGVYNGVNYIHLNQAPHCQKQYDVVISSRTVIPFMRTQDRNQIVHPQQNRFPPTLFADIVKNARQKILWMHDTFCAGDHLIEPLVVEGYIDEIFTLSDWHTSYITTCDHGGKRMFEVLKKHIFVTRNGIGLHKDWVDVKQKNPKLFVYNASVTKGMVPLIENIWPEIRKHIPDAQLKIVGGYYRFDSKSTPDEQELTWRELKEKYKDVGIEFTGIIRQDEIAELLSQASLFLYPSVFPETFGISTLESLAYNTPLVTCKFGALEETAVDNACYLIDYPVEPNGLYPNIDKPSQIQKFISVVLDAYQNTYLHQQKMYACNIVKDICTWDTVALQWKQHFYRILNKTLALDEYRCVSRINRRVHEVFGRRFSNAESFGNYPKIEQKISVIVPFYNAKDYIEDCINSISQQDYENYQVFLIDDCSTDTTKDVVKNVLDQLPENIKNKFQFVVNKTNIGAVGNQITNIRKLDSNDIVMLLDGDDHLVNNPNIFNFYNEIYQDNTEYTYGSCWSQVDNIPLIAQPYPPDVKASKKYREYKFNWNMPYTHLRTFRKSLVDAVPDSAFQDSNGDWYRAGGDNSTFYNIIEQADPDNVRCIPDIIVSYNDINPLNDYKVNSIEQNQTANQILGKPTVKKKILIGIPTNKYIEPETFKSIYDQIVPEGYETEFQFFYGYQIDQIRNLIANWAQRYDYLFSVDSDIVLPSNDTLAKLIHADKDIVSGLYIQRKLGEQTLEIYAENAQGGLQNVPYSMLEKPGLARVGACGFGCVLIKGDVFRKMSYPHFVYQSAIDHKNTISEDVYFCKKAIELGFEVWTDTTVKCDHIGSYRYSLITPAERRLKELYDQDLLPKDHVAYLETMNINPKVVYDIGACVLHWTNPARKIWKDAEFVLFDAVPELSSLYKNLPYRYHVGLLSDQDNKAIKYYNDSFNPGGNSVYKEKTTHYNETHAMLLNSMTLDTIVEQNNFPLPDLIKLDVQGSELDILNGAARCLENCTDVILEAQHHEYNIGAPMVDHVIEYMTNLGFQLVNKFSAGVVDADYHFKKL